MKAWTLAGTLAVLCTVSGASAAADVETRSYLHRSRGHDRGVVEMTVTRNTEGSIIYKVDNLPSGQHGIWASLTVGPDGTPIQYGSGSRQEGGYRWELRFFEDQVTMLKQLPGQPRMEEVIPFGRDRLPDLNSRPDAYLTQHLLIQAYDFTKAGKQAFKVYDLNSKGDNLAGYDVSLEQVDDDGVDLPNGRFKARHILQVQESSAPTWFKKRQGHKTDFWVNEDREILRIYRHREPYELILQDYDRPGDRLAASAPAAAEPVIQVRGNTIWVQATGTRSNPPTARVFLPEGWAVTGGGGRANYGGKGSLLHAPFPIEDGRREGWEVRAKDHAYSDPATLDVWAIGIRKAD